MSRNTTLSKAATRLLLTLVMSSPTALAALADDPPATPPLLQGNVAENGTTPTLQSEEAKMDRAKAFELFANKMASGASLAEDDFRKLNVGCVGFESRATYLHVTPIVIQVYKDSPADKAGVRVGDLVIDDGSGRPNMKPDPIVPMWAITVAQAGTTASIIIERDGQKMTLPIVRMNIEDIQDRKIRREWEEQVRLLGNPTRGTFLIEKPKHYKEPPIPQEILDKEDHADSDASGD